MARIKQTKHSWTVSWDDLERPRSKAIEDYDDALKFKALVEEAGEQMPTIAVLDQNGLIQYGDWIHPGVPLTMLKLMDAAEDDVRAFKQVRELLRTIVEFPR